VDAAPDRVALERAVHAKRLAGRAKQRKQHDGDGVEKQHPVASPSRVCAAFHDEALQQRCERGFIIRSEAGAA
jgi:hypothetical protein